MRKHILLLLSLLLLLAACSGGTTSIPVDPTEQAATAESMIAATRTAHTAEPPAGTEPGAAGTPVDDPTATPTAESRGDLIAFWRDDNGVVDIFVIDPDTGEETNITNDRLAHDFRPVWSPDGHNIAFLSDRQDNWDIYYRPAETIVSQPIPLTISMMPEIAPQWSPAGDKVACYTFLTTQYDILLLDIETKVKANLTVDTEDSSETHPLWSPDGEQILFISDRTDGSDDLYLMTKDGWDVRRLTETPGFDEWDAAWSPDGNRIAFVSERDDNAEIYLIDADGSNLHRVTENPAGDGIPVWSPDGRWLLFVSNRTNNEEIFMLDISCADAASGCEGQEINLTNNTSSDSLPIWSPDGTRIAFISTRDGNEDIFVMDVDGSNPVNLTQSEAKEWVGEWKPRPDQAR